MQTTQQQKTAEDPFTTAFRGTFTSLLSWKNLDEFWQLLHTRSNAGWYIYAVGEPVPESTSNQAEVEKFITEIDALLRRDHREDYCGIVYTDSKTDPAFIKIFDPNNLGVSCGYSDNPPLPGWIMSLLPPHELKDTQTLAAGRRRWWQKLWA
jgi:hypothetical protein